MKTVDKQLEAVKKLSVAWERYAAFVKQAREGAAFSARDEEAFAALGGRISQDYMAALPLLDRPNRGGPVVRHCRQGLSLSATAQERQTLAALETACPAGAKLLHDFQALLERSRRKTISESYVRYSMAKHVGTPRRKQIVVGLGLALMIFLIWGLIVYLHGKTINAAHEPSKATAPPSGIKPGLTPGNINRVP